MGIKRGASSPGVFHVGKSRVLLELMLGAFKRGVSKLGLAVAVAGEEAGDPRGCPSVQLEALDEVLFEKIEQPLHVFEPVAEEPHGLSKNGPAGEQRRCQLATLCGADLVILVVLA